MQRTILEHDEIRLNRLRAECMSLATYNSATRSELREVERRLAIIAQMRALYTDLRALHARVGSIH